MCANDSSMFIPKTQRLIHFFTIFTLNNVKRKSKGHLPSLAIFCQFPYFSMRGTENFLIQHGGTAFNQLSVVALAHLDPRLNQPMIWHDLKNWKWMKYLVRSITSKHKTMGKTACLEWGKEFNHQLVKITKFCFVMTLEKFEKKTCFYSSQAFPKHYPIRKFPPMLRSQQTFGPKFVRSRNIPDLIPRCCRSKCQWTKSN